MKFESTRKKVPPINFSQALFEGLAKDGGLYVPEELPLFDITSFSKEATLIDVAQEIITPFVDEPLKKEVVGICQRAFNFPIPLSVISKSTSILELYHGPTGAFKDVGARFLSECILKIGNGEKRTIIVATSGDTGGAVAGAFHGKPNIDVIILYPKGMISDFQEKQLTCWGNKVHAYKVNGTFDDCQRLVKEALLDKKWSKKNLTSANSINIGRILPQTIYYGWSALHYYNRNQRKPGFIIPSGNLGNSLAALWAKKMGFPIGEVILSFNANKSVVNYFETGKWTPQPTITTLANAMDVGNPSNMERLFLCPTKKSKRLLKRVKKIGIEFFVLIRPRPLTCGQI
jgi:threonine synthase